jgi:ribokinase
MSEIALFGDINIDVLMSIPHYPGAGEDAMATRITLRPGGSVANTGIVLSKLGERAMMIGRVGDDLWADIALEPLINVGIDITNVTRDSSASTGLIFIPVVVDGERTMFSYRGANVRKPVEEIEDDLLDCVSIMHISGYNFLVSPQREATWRAIELAKDAGIALSMDVGVEPAIRAIPDLERILPELSLLIIGPDEAKSLINARTPDQAVNGLLERGVKWVGFKLGKEGSIAANCEQQYLLPGFEVATVDTTGAGDAYCAGLIFAWKNGLSLPASGLLANALGGLATTVWGGGGVLPGSEETINFLRQQKQFLKDIGQEIQALEILDALSASSSEVDLKETPGSTNHD